MLNVFTPVHLPAAIMSKHFQRILGYSPLQQTWAYRRHLVEESFTLVETF